MIIPRSNRMEKKNEGIVIFVGNAARFVTSDMPMAAIAIPQKIILFPVYMMINKVNGVIIQP